MNSNPLQGMKGSYKDSAGNQNKKKGLGGLFSKKEKK